MNRSWLICVHLLLILPWCSMGQGRRDSVLVADTLHGNALPEVIIRAQPSQITMGLDPLSRVHVSASQFQTVRSGNIIDQIAASVPGMEVVKTGPNISKPFIRGLGYFRVLTLYDGLRQEGQQWGDEHGIEIDSYHAASADVIRGPASFMYGSDALAGVVSFVPAEQRERDGVWRGKFIQEYQHNNQLLGHGLRMGAGFGNWLFNIQGSLRMAGNYWNRVDGRVYNTGFADRNVGLRMGYFVPKGNARLNFTLFDDVQGIPDGSRDSLSRQFTFQNEEFPLDDVKSRPLVLRRDLIGYGLSPLHQRIQHYRLYSSFQYALGKGDVHGLIGWQRNGRREFNHPTDTHQAGLSVQLTTLNLDIKYHFPDWRAMRWAAGFQGMYQQNRNMDGTDFPLPDYNLLEGGIFSSGQWKYKWLSVQGGFRMDFRQTRSPDFYVQPRVGSGWMKHVTNANLSTLQYAGFDHHYQGLSWSLGTTISLSDEWKMKLNAARGYRAPNMVEVLSAGLDPGAHIMYLGNRNFEPEHNIQEDIEFEFQQPIIRVVFSLFNNSIAHYIYLVRATDTAGIPLVLDGGNRVFQYRQDKAQLFGGELSTEFFLPDLGGIRVRNDFASVYGLNRSEEFSGKGVQGEFLPFIPPFKWNGALTFPIKLHLRHVEEFSFQMGWEWYARQHRYLGLDRSETATPGYALWHPGLSFAIHAGSFVARVDFRLENVFDRIYQSHLSRLKYFEYYDSSPNGYTGILSMGRSFNLKLTLPIH